MCFVCSFLFVILCLRIVALRSLIVGCCVLCVALVRCVMCCLCYCCVLWFVVLRIERFFDVA